jgi:hypothetical protein
MPASAPQPHTQSPGPSTEAPRRQRRCIRRRCSRADRVRAAAVAAEQQRTVLAQERRP